MAWLVASQGARRTSTGPDSEVGGHHMATRRGRASSGVLHAVFPGRESTACGVRLRYVRVWPTPWPPDVGGMDCPTCADVVDHSTD